MRLRRPDGPERLSLRIGLFILGVWAVLLTACGGAAYSKAAYGAPSEPGGSAAEAPMAPAEPAPMAESAGGEGAAYGFEYNEEAAAGAPMDMETVVTTSDRAAPARMPAPAAQRDERMAQRAPAPPPAQGTAGKKAPGPDQPASPPEPAQIAADASPIQQMLIYTAQLRMAVFETTKSLAAVEQLARELGGFLAHRSDNQLTIRIPAERFDEAMKRISGQGDVLSRNVQVEDVTEQFLDASLRLKNARQVRERIAALLANAKTVEESLQVEQELNRLSEQIERLEGRLKYLSDRARYSTITVTFEPVQADDVNPNRVFQLPFPWLQDLGLGRLMTLR